MSQNPLFSIIMANYNNARYIKEAIESLLKQTYSNWELIFVDDCSYDNSLAIAGEYAQKDTRIKILVNKINLGEGGTKKKGADVASGELLAYFDSDDRLCSRALEVMGKAHINHPEWVLAGSKYIELRGEDILTPYQSPVGPQQGVPDDYLLSHPNRIVAFTVYKMDAYKKTSGFDSQLRSVADKDIYLKLEEVGGENCLGFVDEILYEYRQDNPNSLSLGSAEKLKKCEYNRAWVYLMAYERRYNSKSERYKKYEKLYADSMYVELFRMYSSKLSMIDFKIIHYIFIYLKINKFNRKSLGRSLKLLLNLI